MKTQVLQGQLGVRSIPAVYAFKNGKPVDAFQGEQPESEIIKFVGRLQGKQILSEEAKALAVRAKDSLAAGDAGGLRRIMRKPYLWTRIVPRQWRD